MSQGDLNTQPKHKSRWGPPLDHVFSLSPNHSETNNSDKDILIEHFSPEKRNKIPVTGWTLMTRFGYSGFGGLGATNSGPTSPIKIKPKTSTEGLGYTGMSSLSFANAS